MSVFLVSSNFESTGHVGTVTLWKWTFHGGNYPALHGMEKSYVFLTCLHFSWRCPDPVLSISKIWRFLLVNLTTPISQHLAASSPTLSNDSNLHVYATSAFKLKEVKAALHDWCSRLLLFVSIVKIHSKTLSSR